MSTAHIFITDNEVASLQSIEDKGALPERRVVFYSEGGTNSNGLLYGLYGEAGYPVVLPGVNVVTMNASTI